MKIINLFAGPGSGKSTTAAGLFYLMKSKQHNVELVTEYAKDLTWEERAKTFDNQIYIFAKQYHRLFRLQDKVDWVITDSPLLLSVVYAKQVTQSFTQLVLDTWNAQENISFFLERVKPYSNIGRVHSFEQAKEVDIKVKDLLDYYKIPYKSILGDFNAPEDIYEYLEDNQWI
jgi:ABC-type oligopeptide transport system ATPase subunit